MNMKKLLKLFLIEDRWLNHRVVAAVIVCLCTYRLYYSAYIDHQSDSSRYPFSFLFLSVIAGNLGAIYLIEHYDSKWQLVVGYLVQCFFIIALLVDPLINLLKGYI